MPHADPGARRVCAFLTYDRLPSGTPDDRLAVAPLESLGWTVRFVPWRDAARGGRFDVVVIRSAWDYHRHLDEFLDALAAVVGGGARLLNRLELVRWNARKRYLRDLEGRAIRIVPTVWRDRLEPGGTEELFEALRADDVIVKPAVSASAEGAERIVRHAGRAGWRVVEERFAQRPLMAQPVVRAIFDEGEYSLVYLGGSFSHAVRKIPRAGDFRVQEEHGGTGRHVDPEASLRMFGDAVLAALPGEPLYARIDIVRGNDGSWWLMEVELIEPALYLGVQPGAPERFARSLAAVASGAPLAAGRVP